MNAIAKAVVDRVARYDIPDFDGVLIVRAIEIKRAGNFNPQPPDQATTDDSTSAEQITAKFHTEFRKRIIVYNSHMYYLHFNKRFQAKKIL